MPQEKLICETGIYPAWHMNKKKWISVLLDDTLKDERIFSLIRTSRKLVSGNAVQKASNEWIVPANPNYFNLYSYLRMNSVRDWSQPVNAKPGDIVYIYSSAPDSAIVFKTIVVESDLPQSVLSGFIQAEKIHAAQGRKTLSEGTAYDEGAAYLRCTLHAGQQARTAGIEKSDRQSCGY